MYHTYICNRQERVEGRGVEKETRRDKTRQDSSSSSGKGLILEALDDGRREIRRGRRPAHIRRPDFSFVDHVKRGRRDAVRERVESVRSFVVRSLFVHCVLAIHVRNRAKKKKISQMTHRDKKRNKKELESERKCVCERKSSSTHPRCRNIMVALKIIAAGLARLVPMMSLAT